MSHTMFLCQLSLIKLRFIEHQKTNSKQTDPRNKHFNTRQRGIVKITETTFEEKNKIRMASVLLDIT